MFFCGGKARFQMLSGRQGWAGLLCPSSHKALLALWIIEIIALSQCLRETWIIKNVKCSVQILAAISASFSGFYTSLHSCPSSNARGGCTSFPGGLSLRLALTFIPRVHQKGCACSLCACAFVGVCVTYSLWEMSARSSPVPYFCFGKPGHTKITVPASGVSKLEKMDCYSYVAVFVS